MHFHRHSKVEVEPAKAAATAPEAPAAAAPMPTAPAPDQLSAPAPPSEAAAEPAAVPATSTAERQGAPRANDRAARRALRHARRRRAFLSMRARFSRARDRTASGASAGARSAKKHRFSMFHRRAHANRVLSRPEAERRASLGDIPPKETAALYKTRRRSAPDLGKPAEAAITPAITPADRATDLATDPATNSPADPPANPPADQAADPATDRAVDLAVDPVAAPKAPEEAPRKDGAKAKKHRCSLFRRHRSAVSVASSKSLRSDGDSLVIRHLPSLSFSSGSTGSSCSGFDASVGSPPATPVASATPAAAAEPAPPADVSATPPKISFNGTAEGWQPEPSATNSTWGDTLELPTL